MDTPNPLITPAPTTVSPPLDPALAPVPPVTRTIGTWVLLIIGFLISAFFSVPAGLLGGNVLATLGVFGPPGNLEMAIIVVWLGGIVVASFALPLLMAIFVWFVSRLMKVYLPHFFIMLSVFIIGGWFWLPLSFALNIREGFLIRQLQSDPQLDQKFTESMNADYEKDITVQGHKDITVSLVADSIAERSFESEEVRGYTYSFELNIENTSDADVPFDGYITLMYKAGPESMPYSDEYKAQLVVDDNLRMASVANDRSLIADEWPRSLEDKIMYPGSNIVKGEIIISNLESNGGRQRLVEGTQPIDDSKMFIILNTYSGGDDYEYHIPTTVQGWDGILRGLNIQ